MPDGANHVAFAYSADGKDRFMTVYPNLNLLDGTKDFSGAWWTNEGWEDDGTYKGLTVKRKTGLGPGITRQFIAPKDGVYTFSSYVKSPVGADIQRRVTLNGVSGTIVPDKSLGNSFDWKRDSFQVTLKAGDKIYTQYQMTGGGSIWTAGHKWEHGSTATEWMPSFSEVTTEDYPSYIGTYTDNDSSKQSTDPARYTWEKIE